MPKLVDHRERRREIGRITSDIIAESGVDAVTIRSIAERLNYSTGIVQHYFSNKRQLLMYTLRMEGSLGQRRVEAAVANDPADLVAMLGAMLPVDGARVKSWKTWLAYWSTATLDPEVAMEQRRLFEAVRVMIAHCLKVHGRSAGLRSGLDLEMIARRLLALTHGIGMEAVCHPDDWPAGQQLLAVADEIRDLTGLDMGDQLAAETGRLKRGRR